MRAWSMLVLLALLPSLAGCLDDAPERLDAAGADEEPPDVVAAKPLVKTVEGGWTAQAGPLRVMGSLPPEFQVPREATWILEVVWDPNPTTQEMTILLYDGTDITEFTGASPLRVEFPENAPTGTLALDSGNAVGVETFFTAHVSIFDGVPFDARWSALDG